MRFACRPATPDDTAALLEVHRAAFSTDLEAELVASLIASTSPGARESWVAVDTDEVVGHVLLTSGRPQGSADLPVMLLCPLAVVPRYQNDGVGSAITRACLDAAAGTDVLAVMVFGDPEYYSRFGFEALLPDGPQPPFDVGMAHRDAWQTLLLTDDEHARQALDNTRIEWASPLMRSTLWQH